MKLCPEGAPFELGSHEMFWNYKTRRDDRGGPLKLKSHEWFMAFINHEKYSWGANGHELTLM